MPHITTCETCGKCYEESSEEVAKQPSNYAHDHIRPRECGSCWLKREEAEHELREFAECERQISTGGF